MGKEYRKKDVDKAYKALEMKLKVKTEHCARLSRHLRDYLEFKGPLKSDEAAMAALTVRNELVEEIEDIEKLLEEREV